MREHAQRGSVDGAPEPRRAVASGGHEQLAVSGELDVGDPARMPKLVELPECLGVEHPDPPACRSDRDPAGDRTQGGVRDRTAASSEDRAYPRADDGLAKLALDVGRRLQPRRARGQSDAPRGVDVHQGVRLSRESACVCSTRSVLRALPLEEREQRDGRDGRKREERGSGDRDRTSPPPPLECELAFRFEGAAPREHPLGENVVEDLVTPVSLLAASPVDRADDALRHEMAEDAGNVVLACTGVAREVADVVRDLRPRWSHEVLEHVRDEGALFRRESLERPLEVPLHDRFRPAQPIERLEPERV